MPLADWRVGHWEAKDTHDDLDAAAFSASSIWGIRGTIIFEDSREAVLIQNGDVAISGWICAVRAS